MTSLMASVQQAFSAMTFQVTLYAASHATSFAHADPTLLGLDLLNGSQRPEVQTTSVL